MFIRRCAVVVTALFLFSAIFTAAGFAAEMKEIRPDMPKRPKRRVVEVELPDLSKVTPLESKRINKLDPPEGKETIHTSYIVNGNLIFTYAFENGKIYGFTTAAFGDPDVRHFWDTDNDGIFDLETASPEDFSINLTAYGVAQ